MPTYEYACKSCGEHLEVVQSFKYDPLTKCPACKKPVRKIISSPLSAKKLSLMDVPCGGNTSNRRRKSLRTWSGARRSVAVEAITWGRTRFPFTVHEHISSTTVS